MKSPFNHRLRAAWGLSALLLLPLGASAADESIWVRINGPAPAGDVARGLVNYDSFSWGQVSADQLRQLTEGGTQVQVVERPFELDLGGLRFDPLTSFPRLASRSEPAAPGANFRLIQFNGPIRPEWTRSMRGTGMEVVQYIHPYTYVVWADEGQVSAARNMSGVRWTGDFAPEFRVVPEQRGLGDAVEATMVMVSRHADLDAVRAQLSAHGARVMNSTPYLGHFHLLEVAAPGSVYMELGRVPAVYTVQRAQPIQLRGEMSNQAITGDSTSNQDVTPGYANWLAATGYDGTGVRVSVMDGGVRGTHQDLAAAMDPCVSQGTPTSCTTANDSHGTHVAGAIAGRAAAGTVDADGFLRGQGVAPGARVVQQRYGSPGLLYSFGATCTNPGGQPYCLTPSGALILFKEAQLSGVTHANNSWGSTSIKIGYDIPSQQVDVVTRDANPDVPGAQPVLPVWSIMNGGGDSAGACGGNSLGAPDEAKNLFAVGSTQLIPGNHNGTFVPNPSNFFNVSGNSAHGPACDGRVGVHIVAPGCATDAPIGTGDAAYSAGYCGTSMASPVVSGALAIFIQRYRDLYEGVTPSPALMKAALMGSAINMHGQQNADGGTITQTPSRFQGYGRVDLDASVNPPYNVMYFDQETVFDATGQDWTLPLVADDPAEPVRLMLVWTDAHGAGLAGTTPAWVNDLDLAVNAGSDLYRGNVIGTDGFSETGGSADARNNMEAVFLRADQHGGNAFNVTVSAANIAADALNPHSPGSAQQDFALVCYNCDFGEPAFTLSVVPQAAAVCVPESGSTDLTLDVDVGVLSTYTGTVALTSTGEPAGVTGSFDPASVAAPGASEWTLTITDAALPGITAISVVGNDGTTEKDTPFLLTLDVPLDAPTLSAPADEATDVDLQPVFAWDALTGAVDYRIQVASVEDFSTTLIDETLADTSFTPASDLPIGTDLYWRVQALNGCGDGEWSEVSGFQTRFEPVADISPLSFSFQLPAGTASGQELLIENTGTGNLLWSIDTDELRRGGGAGSRGFEGPFAIDNWTFSAGPGGSHTVNPGPPVELHLTGGNAGSAGNTDFSIQVPQDGTIHFDWGFQSLDEGEWDSGGYAVNGTYTVLAFNNTQVPYFDESASVSVSAGDTFAFRAYTDDGTFGAGTLGVTHFLFEPEACANVVPVPWLSADPASGSTAADSVDEVTITVDAAGLPEGQHEAWLCVNTNTTSGPQQVAIPVSVEVTQSLDIFEDGFED